MFLIYRVHVPQWCRSCATLRGDPDTYDDSYVWVCVCMWWMGSLRLVSQNHCTPRSLDSGLSCPGRIPIDAHWSKACRRGRPRSLIWSVCTHRSRLPTVVALERFVSIWATGRNSRLFVPWLYPVVSAKWMRHALPAWPPWVSTHTTRSLVRRPPRIYFVCHRQ